ncbi:MAG: response regulator [Oscillospiraceae bacterium]|nr:response regulator [Oscillospiraceae bacterium]
MQKMIFVVDDNLTNLLMAENALEKQYSVLTLSSASKMFKALERAKPDMILLDIEMPEMDGFEAIKRLKANDSYANIPVIFLTAHGKPDIEARGIELGAVDFIVKPFSDAVLLNRIRNHLNIDELIRDRTEQLLSRTERLLRMQNGMLFMLANVVEIRDPNTGGHIGRTTIYISILLEAMLAHGVYADEIKNWSFDLVVSSARLHDVGKIAVPDAVLRKTGKLTSEEFEIIKTHSLEGRRIIERAIEETGEEDFLLNAKLMAAYHHERWNGLGYPYGLKGTDIPLQGRIMAIADVYEALTSERPYKEAFSHEKAVQIITEDSGKHFDPVLVNVFLEEMDKFDKARPGSAPGGRV